MFCPHCSHDRFEIARVWRNKRWDANRHSWLWADDVDSRMIACKRCGTVYITETRILTPLKLGDNGLPTVEVA